MYFFCGGGIKLGIIYGVIDEFGYYVVDNVVWVYDMYVIMLYLLGIDYECFKFKY